MSNLLKHTIDNLVDSRTTNVEPEWFSEILNRLLWVLDYEKIDIASNYKQWLIDADDKFKVAIALTEPEIFPLQDQELVQVFQTIGEKWPDLHHLCDDMVKNYKQSKRNKS